MEDVEFYELVANNAVLESCRLPIYSRTLA